MSKTITATAVVAVLAIASPAASQDNTPPPILFTNANVFDGFSPDLIEGANVLVEGNAITQVSTDPIDAPNAFVVDVGGKTMTPGFIDMHQHVMLNPPEGTAAYQTRWDDAAGGAIALQYMNDHMLMKGITTVRDIAGDPLDIAKAIDMGLVRGPRVYSSGGAIGQTGGHSDWAGRNVPPATLENGQDMGQLTSNTWVTDGVDDVTRAARLNFRRGAAFLKVMGGGGVASEFDPLEILGLAEDEVARAVEIARDNGTYVAVHAYHDESYDRHLRLGTRSFEHGFLISEDMVKRMVAKYNETKDIVWSFQCYVSVNTFGSYESMPAFFTHEQKLKGVAVGEGVRAMSKWMNDYGMFIIGGSDMFSPGLVEKIKEDIVCPTSVGFSPAQALKHYTGNAGIVLKWSGPKDPYPTYHLGRIAPDSYADILIWDGNPLEDINLILDESKLQLVMKDGRAYKNTMVESDSIMYRPAVREPAVYP
ncbi:amidohydrolase family protein [Ruegeria sp. HKCCSP351]|uniref:amidohydrolase family protein n=1 Tax=Ruegeria sp. HKCCSP351 TaxID=2794832 RepID=UPI001AE51484|nr:amidohydrolase family protein [Ruegeria sp. HKCCSP351]